MYTHVYTCMQIHMHLILQPAAFAPGFRQKNMLSPYLELAQFFGCLHYAMFLAWPDSVEHRHTDRHIVCQRWSPFCFILSWFSHCGRGGRNGKRPELQSGSYKI